MLFTEAMEPHEAVTIRVQLHAVYLLPCSAVQQAICFRVQRGSLAMQDMDRHYSLQGIIRMNQRSETFYVWQYRYAVESRG